MASYYADKFKELDKKRKQGVSSTSDKEKQEETKTTSAAASSGGNSSFSAKRFKELDEKRKKNMASSLTQDEVDAWFTEASTALQAMQDYHKQNEGKYNTSYGGDTAKKVKELMNSSGDVYRYLQTHRGEMSNFKEVSKAFSEYQAALEQNDLYNYQTSRHYSKFDSEEDYNLQKTISDIDNMSSAEIKTRMNEEGAKRIAYTTPDGKNVTWQSLYDSKRAQESIDFRYEYYSSRPDWEEKSQGITTHEDTRSDYDIVFELSRTNVPYDKETAIANGVDEETFNDIEEKRNYISNKYGVDLYDDIYNNINIFNELMVQLESQEGEREQFEYIPYLSAKERQVLSYIFNTQGRAAALDWQNSIEGILQDRANQYQILNMSMWADEHPVLSSAGSVALNTFAGIQYIGDALDYVATGEMDTNQFALASSTIRGTVSEKVDWEIGNWDAFDFIYNTGMSMADSAASMATMGSFGGVSQGLSAAAQATNDALNRGVPKDRAFWTGVIAGTLEGLFESFSIGKLNAMKEMPVSTYSDIAKNISKLMLVNASEETFTEIGNITADLILNGDFSQYETAVRQYMNQGMTESEANKKALWDTVGQVVEAGASGALMGFGFGVTGSAGQYAALRSDHNQQIADHGQSIINEGGVDALKQLALDMYSVKGGVQGLKGTNLTDKVFDNASAKNVGKLSAHMGKTISAQNKADIEAALVEKGLSKKDAKRVSEYLGSTQALTAEQKAEIDGNEKIKAVVTELLDNPESVISERGRNLLGARLGIDTRNAKINASSNGKLSLKNDVDVNGRVSETGKTTLASTGKEVTIDKSNPIAKIKDVDGERVVYLNTDQGKVKASDIKYANATEGILYEAFADMNPAFANAAIKNYDGSVPIQTYVKGMREGMILYGMHNFQAVGKDISKNSYLAELSATDQAFALKLGRAYAKADAKKATTDLRRAIKNAADKAKASEGASTSEATQNKAKKGNVSFVNGATAGKQHKKIVSLAKHLARAMGIDIAFYDSTIEGTYGSDANGYFDEQTDTIYLDLQKATTDAKTIAFTLSHELVHFIKKWSPQKYATFAEFLMDQYAAHGVSAANLLKKKMAELGTTDADFAYEEMIADACETMLLDSNAVVKLMELRKSDLELFEKIKLHIHKLLNDIREAYKKMGYEPSSDEAKALLGMKDVLQQFYSLFEEAAVDATKNYQALGTEGYNELVAKSTENANETVFGEASVDVGKTEPGVKHQLKAHKTIGENAIAYNERHKAVHKAILQVGVESMYEMAEAMLPYLEEEGILPPDIPGKTIFKNGSYGKTGENTTLCVRTLTYEDFKDRVAEKVGRPLTVSESLLVSQKIYDIATEPQCIYCYVAADRKAYDEYLGEYWKAMDKYIKALRKGGDSQTLYTEYLAGRKDTTQQRKRWSQWEAIAKSGKEYISSKDLTTKRKRDGIIARKNAFSEQIKDAQRYAQSASWAKTVFDYRAYKGDILKMTAKFVDMLNSEYGLRMYSFSDYTPAFIVENMQMIIDASVKGLKSLAYTKDTDYVEIFASTGQAINVSCFAKWDAGSGTYVEDNRQGANWEKTKNLRKQYRNVGAVMVATNDAMVEWALKQDWVDVVIPYHIVKTGTTIANEYQWNNYTSESSDKAGNRAANIYPTEHNNDFATYSNLLNERGITPRFSRWYDKVASGELTEDQYMKLVNEVRLPASELSPVIPSFNLEAAKKSFGIDNEGKVIKGGFVDKGGYMGGWYRQGVDVNQEVMAVSEDIKAGKSSLDVDYGMSKAAKEKVEERYKKQAKKMQGNIYDYSKSFAEQIDDYKNGLIPQNDTLLVSGTPNVWKKAGFNALPVTINQTHIDYALNGTKDSDHHIGETLLKDLPNAIQKPVAIIQSQSPTRNDRAVVILKMTHNGKNVIGAIEVDGQGITNSINIDSNAMTSLYAKSNALTQLNKAINNTVNGGVELFYWDKKEAITLLQNNGLQLSKTLPQDGFVHSIHDNGSNVKTKFKNITETQQFKRWFGDWQKNPKKASKIVNPDGTPMVVYHGTNADFSVFDANRTSRTTKRYADGFYFTTEKKVAEKWGKFRAKENGGNSIVMECFLDVKNPLIMTAKEYQRLGFDDKHRDSVLQKLVANKNDGIIIYPEEERIPGVFADSYNYEAGDSVYYNADKYGITDKDYAWWLNRAVENPDFTAMQVAVFSPEQIKSATDNIGTFDADNPNIHYQKKTDSNRSLLANALESVAQNDIERNKLKQYKDKIALIESEQAKLAELKGKIKELSFAKGRRDTEAIKSLQFEANQAASRINTYDRQLLTLESTAALKGVLDREKQMAYKKAQREGKEALEAYREKTTKTQRELLTRYQDSRKKGIESRRKTEMRHKIKKVVSELNQLLLHGSKERNVKLGLQQAVASALDAINMDTVGADERVAKYNALIAKATDADVIASLEASRDRIQAQGDSLGDKLKALKDAYYDIQHGEEGKNYPTYFKEEASLIEQRIQSTIKTVGNTSLRDMSLKQLNDVYDMYKIVLTTIQNANAVWREGRAEDLQQNASAVMSELEKLKKLKGEGTRLGEALRSYSWNEMTPYYAFERIGSKTLTSFFWETIKGQNTYANDVDEAKAFADSVRKKYGYKQWNLDKVFQFTLKDGRTFEVTLKHMLSIYAYSKREQALPHMSTGGFFFNDKSTFRKKGGILELIKRDDEGYKIDADILAEIKDAMTKEQLSYVDEMQEYLTKMGEKGNEVTRVLWGIDIFKEKVYFPLKSKDDFIKRSTETAQSVSLKNDGMTKETVPGASNPIVLEAFDDVWSSHIDRMSQYHAFVIPIDNLNKIHQYGTWSGTASMSVSTMLTARFGSAVNEYISQFIKDLNGNVVSQGAKNPLMGFLSKFKKTAVGASTSTVVQQPTAIIRAAAVLDAKYFAGKPNLNGLSKKWAELKKYAPIAIIKEIGGFDAGSGVQVSRWLNSDALTGIDKIMNTIDDFSMKGAEVADQFGWTTIWEAVKREIKATTNLTVGSEAFLKKAGERFTEVIVKTQVYDSTLSRSGFMRSKSDLMKMLTAFMGEPTLSINMMYNAITNVSRGGSKAKAARTIGYTYASIIAASAMASLIYALRDDDEDESYLEKYLQSIGGELISDVALAPITSLPAIKDIVSIFQGWDVERTDVAIFKDIKDAFDGLDSENKSTYRKIEDLAGAMASAFGVPLKNLLRTGREIYNAFDFATDGITGGDLGSAFVEGVTGKEKSDSQQLYEAMISGDSTQIEKVKSRFKDQNAINSAIRKALRENDPRIKEAAEARYNGDIAEYMRIAKKIIAEGNFKQDDIVAAINSEISALKKGEGSSETTTSTNKVESIYKVDDYYAALVGRDQATAYVVKEDLIKTDVANGKDREDAEADFNSKFTSYIREEYEKGEISSSNAKNMLVNYGGKTKEEADSRIQYWDFKKEYPDYDDLSEEAVTKYYEEVEPYGIGIGTYYDYTKQRAKCEGTDSNGDGRTDSGSVKAEVLLVINSLPISNKQKDALYYLNGWSAKTIYEAPWH